MVDFSMMDRPACMQCKSLTSRQQLAPYQRREKPATDSETTNGLDGRDILITRQPRNQLSEVEPPPSPEQLVLFPILPPLFLSFFCVFVLTCANASLRFLTLLHSLRLCVRLQRKARKWIGTLYLQMLMVRRQRRSPHRDLVFAAEML